MKDSRGENVGIVAEGGDWSVGREQGKSLQNVFENVIVRRRNDVGIAEDIEAQKQNCIDQGRFFGTDVIKRFVANEPIQNRRKVGKDLDGR